MPLFLVVLGLVGCVVALPHLARRARIPAGVLLAHALATVTFGAIGAAPALVLLVIAIAIGSSGGLAGSPWTALFGLLLGGATAGVGGAAAFVGWAARARVGRRALRVATATLGAVVIGAVVASAAILGGEAHAASLFVVLPIGVVVGSMVGFTFPRASHR